MRTINAAPSTVGEILYEEFLKPLDMPPARLAELMDTSYEKILEITRDNFQYRCIFLGETARAT